MKISAMTTSATRWGAALQGVRMPLSAFTPQWAFEPSGIGLGLAYASVPQPAGGSELAVGTGMAACTAVLAGAGVESVTGSGTAMGAVAGDGATRRLHAINGHPTDNRKQQYLHKTRVTADGGGAPGPEPEREQALQAKASQIPFRPRTRETRVRGLAISRGPGPTPLDTEEDQEAKGDGTDAVARRLHERHERDGDRGNAG